MHRERWLGASGALYALLIFVGDDMLAGEAPGLDATKTDVVRYVAQQQDGFQPWLGHVIALIGVGFLLLFFSRLHVLLRDGTSSSTLPVFVLAAGVTAVAVHVASYATFGAILLGENQGFDPDASRLAIYIGSALFVLVWLPLALALLAAAVVILRSRVLPRWFGYATAVQAAIFLAGLVTIQSSYAGYVAYPLFWIWLVAASIVLVRHRVAVEPTLSPA